MTNNTIIGAAAADYTPNALSDMLMQAIGREANVIKELYAARAIIQERDATIAQLQGLQAPVPSQVTDQMLDADEVQSAHTRALAAAGMNGEPALDPILAARAIAPEPEKKVTRRNGRA